MYLHLTYHFYVHLKELWNSRLSYQVGAFSIKCVCDIFLNNLLFYIDCRDEVRLHGFTVVAVIQGATTSIINTLLESLYLFEVRNALVFEGKSSLKKDSKQFHIIELYTPTSMIKRKHANNSKNH